MATQVRPSTLVIEPNASCQLRCPTCPTTGRGYPPVVGSGHLRAEHFDQLLKDNPMLRAVQFESRGEMFLNPDLLHILECGSKRSIEMSCDSGANFNLVRDGVIDGLVTSGFRHLLCSIDGATPETYAAYRIGGDFDQVMRNIEALNRSKRAHDSRYPLLSWQFVVFGHNEHELPAARARVESLGMAFRPKLSWDSAYSPISDAEFVRKHTGWRSVTREEFEGMTGRDYMRDVCGALWNSPRINWDGKVLGCCWNSWAEFGGNAFGDGYQQAINSDGIIHARQMLMGKAGHVDGLPCSTCELYMKLRDTGAYLTKREIRHRQSRLYRTLRRVYRGSPLLQRARTRVVHSLR